MENTKKKIGQENKKGSSNVSGHNKSLGVSSNKCVKYEHRAFITDRQNIDTVVVQTINIKVQYNKVKVL